MQVLDIPRYDRYIRYVSTLSTTYRDAARTHPNYDIYPYL